MKQLILASSSPSRKELMERVGIDFVVDPSNYEEDMTLNLSPKELAIFLSKGKASEVAKRHKNAVILGADSFATLNGELFGKPHELKRAKESLRKLSGKTHDFITGFTIIDADSGKQFSDAVLTKVHIKELSDSEIENYLAKENVLSNAGSYIIQGLGGTLVERIEGDYFNVTGLPLSKIVSSLKDFGINII